MVIGSRSSRKRLTIIAITAISLLAVIAAIGVLLVWLTGEETVKELPVNKTETKRQDLRPRTPSPNATPFVAREYLISPVAPGVNSTINIKTVPTSKCVIKITYNDVVSTDSGLQDKTADELGSVSWSWTVPASTPEGTWPIDIYCYYKDKSAYLHENLVVKKDVVQ